MLYGLRALGRLSISSTPFSSQRPLHIAKWFSLSRNMATYSVEERGSRFSKDYRVYFKSGEQYISPFHDIPLSVNEDMTVLNMVVEVPRWANAKMEIAIGEVMNPIKQDIKNDKVRFVHNCFPYHGYIWNYGAFPQTWEDPNHLDANTNCKGDNDPIDVCEIGTRIAKTGEVKQVKVLGTLALIDEGETDWKILAIDINDDKANLMNDIGDIETHMPGLLEATVNWFRIYKMPAGKPANQFAFNGEAKDRSFAMEVVRETNRQWKSVMEGKIAHGSLNLSNTTLSSADSLSASAAAEVVSQRPPLGQPCPIPNSVDDWHYVSAR